MSFLAAATDGSSKACRSHGLVTARTRADDPGAILVLCLMMLALMVALALCVASVATLEVRESFVQRESARVREAARAALDVAASALGRSSSLSAVLAGFELAPFVGPDVVVLNADRSQAVDLVQRRARLQRRTDAEGQFGANQPQWRRYLSGHLSTIASRPLGRDDVLVVAWVADDQGEADGDPASDSNGTVMLHAEAHGAAGVRAALRGSVERRAGWFAVRARWVAVN